MLRGRGDDHDAIEVLAAIASEERLVVLGALAAHGPTTLGALADRSGLSTAQVRKAVAALAAAGLVAPDRDGGALHLRLERIRAVVQAAVAETPLGRVMPDHPELESVLRLGRIAAIPPAGPARSALLSAVLAALPEFDQATEQELTAWLATMGDDPVLLRRLLVDEGLIERTPDGTRYWTSAKVTRSR